MSNYLKTKFLLFNRTALKCKFSAKVTDFEIEQKVNIKYILRYYYDRSMLKIAYYSLLYLDFQYCISPWAGTASCHLKLFVSMQKSILKYDCCKLQLLQLLPTISQNKKGQL